MRSPSSASTPQPNLRSSCTGLIDQSRGQWHGRGLGLVFRPCKGTRCRNQVAEVAKALYQRTDDLVVLLARAITRDSWSSPLMLGGRRRGAALDRVHAEQHRRVFRGDGRMPTMTALQ